MNTRFEGKKHVATGFSSSTSRPSQPTAKRGRGRPRKNPLPPLVPIAPIVPPAFQGPRPRPPPLLNPALYLPPGFVMENEIENRPVLQGEDRDRRIDGDEMENLPARHNDDIDDERPPAPPRYNRNWRDDDENDERPVGDYMTPTLEGNGSVILPPDEDAFDFDVKSSLVHMVTNDQFQGVGNPSTHLASFQEYCRTYKPRNTPVEYVYLKLFPSSLYGDAKEWLQNHDPGTFRTWDHLATAFLNKFYPPSRTKKFTDFILTFSQRDNELFHQAYDRFKHYLRECPHHNFRKADLMRYFYLGMSKEAKNQMDTASGGAIMELPATQVFKIVDKIAINSDRYQGVDHKKMGKSRDDSSNYATKEQINELSKRMESMISMVNSVEATKPKADKERTSAQQPCFLCASTRHSTKNCPDGRYEDDDDGYEEAHFVNQQRNYAQNANPITRNYEPPQRRMSNDSNFPPRPQGQNSYSNQGNYQRQNQQGQSSQAQQKPPYQSRANYQHQQHGNYQEMNPQQPQASTHQSTQDKCMTDILANLVANQAKAAQDSAMMFQTLQTMNQRMGEMSTHSKMLEMQIAQQAESSTKAQGKLPARPEHDKKEYCNALYVEGSFEDDLLERKEHIEAVTLRSGKKLEVVAPKKAVQMPPKPVGQARAEEREFNEEVPNPPTVKAKESEERKEELKPYSPPVPFPQRLIKPSKLDKEYEVFTKMLKKLYVYIPFHELIKKAPLYNKFLKEILSKKRTIEEVEPHPLNHECSALFSKQIPQKMGDPGKFTIPCSIGDMNFSSPLADLGASAPLGASENVPIKVDKFYIPCDFVVIDMGDNCTSSLILGRPFLATAGFKVDLGKGKVTLKIGGEKIKIERPTREQVAIQDPYKLEEQESAKTEKVEVKKDLYKSLDPDEDPPLDHYRLPLCNDGVKRKANAKTVKSGKQASLWTRAIKQVACNSSKNPD
ncbi:unnamed protein product [Rhodiola kirilowii]